MISCLRPFVFVSRSLCFIRETEGPSCLRGESPFSGSEDSIGRSRSGTSVLHSQNTGSFKKAKLEVLIVVDIGTSLVGVIVDTMDGDLAVEALLGWHVSYMLVD